MTRDRPDHRSRPAPLPGGRLDIHSRYAHLRIRDAGSVRALYFVLDDGEEVHEGRIDLARPHELLGRYAHSMMATHLFVPRPASLLLIGLGPGALIHFLRHRHPRLRIDAIEIDPDIRAIATRYFGVSEDDRTRLMVGDGVSHVQRIGERYDVILVDAFLPPSPVTDDNGIPLTATSGDFHGALRDRLRPGGVVAFNHAEHDGHHDRLALLRAAFSTGFRFSVRGYANEVAIASMATVPLTTEELTRRGATLDTEWADLSFSFAELALQARPWS